MAIPFSQILDTAMESNSITTVGLEEILKSKGINNIGFRRISEYRSSKTTPSFEKAKSILACLNINMTEEELLDSLHANRQSIKYLKYTAPQQDEILKIHANLNLMELFPDREPDEVAFILDERIESLYGDAGNRANYVKDLILKDLKEYILTRKDTTHGDEDNLDY